MSKEYYTYRIRILDKNSVRVEVRNPQNEVIAEPSGAFGYKGVLREQIDGFKEAAQKELLRGSQVKAFGEALFNAIFDSALRHNFVALYHKAVRGEGNLLRIELDINEQAMPAVAALPWEFMRVPRDANLGTIWLGTASGLIFSRRRAQWHTAPPIQLAQGERLRIALAVAAPTKSGQDKLDAVAYEEVLEALQTLAMKQATRIELLPLVEQANPGAIHDILRQKPHIFHFIGHGQLAHEEGSLEGQIALVDDIDDSAMWVDADYFSDLFTEHQPAVVMLQACEGGTLSASEAFVGVASRVVQQNIPVVVAMQYKITNSTAKRFALRFYQELAADYPVDQAAQSGRLWITRGTKQYKARDFATPVIFMRVRNGHLFQRESATPPPSSPSSASPQAPTSTSYHATVINGVSAQGTGATAVGAGGISIGGNVGGNVIAAQPSPSAISPASLPANLSFKQKGVLVKALLACPTISNRLSRNTVLNHLSANIKNNIARSPVDHVDVTNLVSTCLNYPHGLQELLNIVRYYEGNSWAMQEVEQVVDSLRE